MHSSKSFCNISAFLSNTPGVVSGFGELSQNSYTFSREIGIHQKNSVPGFTILNLKTVNDAGTRIEMDQILIDQAIFLSKAIYDYIGGLVGEVFADQILQNLQPLLTAEGIDSVIVGPVSERNGRWFPDWIKWVSDTYPHTNDNTIWFSDSSLTSQYSEYDIVVVPSITPIDSFFLAYSTVNTNIANLDFSDIQTAIQVARGVYPFTYQDTTYYDYVNPLNVNQKIPCPWSVIIYGPAGNNIDAKKEAIASYILANSARDRTDWVKIFPDIFRRTEFVLAPHWHKYAIPNRAIDEGVYSPIAQVNQIGSFLKLVVPSYTQTHIDDNSCVFGHSFNSLAISSIGSIENRDSKFKLTDFYPDYIDVPSTSVDFSRMDPATQQFSTHLNTMLSIAEDMTQFSDVPAGYTKLIRDNVLFVVRNMNNVQFLVASKASVNSLMGIV